jgi:hypothetical protein
VLRLAARGVLLVLALACFVVAAVGLSTTSSGRPVLTWMSGGLAFLTLALLVDLRGGRGGV